MLIDGVDATGAPIQLPVVTEKPITLFLNKQEIVTSMTLGDWVPELAVGYFLNQNMLASDDEIMADWQVVLPLSRKNTMIRRWVIGVVINISAIKDRSA